MRGEHSSKHLFTSKKQKQQKKIICLQRNNTVQEFERQQIKVFLFHLKTIGLDCHVKVVKQ